jgi:dihydroneopterin aldolase
MKIRLHSIEIFAHHGVYDEEIHHGNHFEIDLEVEIADSFGSTDSLADTLDYTQVYKTVLKVSESKRYNLIESLAHEICTKILAEFTTIDRVQIKLRKLNPPIAGSVRNVEVELEMKRNA